MAKYVQVGDTIDYTNNDVTKVSYGDVVAGTNRAFIAKEEILPGGTGGVSAKGVYEVPSETTAAFTFGQKVYWDLNNKVATATTGNVFLGIVVESKAQSLATCKVKLDY